MHIRASAFTMNGQVFLLVVLLGLGSVNAGLIGHFIDHVKHEVEKHGNDIGKDWKKLTDVKKILDIGVSDILFTLPLSRFVSISQTCGRVSLATKCEFCPKLACFGSFWGLFGYNFCLPLQKQLRKAHHRGSATSCMTYQLRSLSVCNRTISTVGHGICLFFQEKFQALIIAISIVSN